MSLTPSDESQRLMSQARKEMDDLKSMATAFGPARLRDGSWFEEFVRSMLDSYAREIIAKGGVEFFRRKYPGLTQDAIVDKLCDLAMKYAALSGGLSGATSSAAFAATIGTGGVGLITVPAAVTAIGADILFTTRLQVRLIYDVSTVFGYPIDLSDPEDLMRAFSMAYGITAAAGGAGTVVKAVTPEIARAQLRALTLGHTAAIQAAIRAISPRIGSQITQKAILKAAVPVVGIAISSGWNYVSTRQIAAIAKPELRLSALARDAARDIIQAQGLSAADASAVFPALAAILLADGRLEPREQEIYKFVRKTLEVPASVLASLESRVEADLPTIEADLRAVTAPAARRGIAELCRLGTAVRGEIAPEQATVLARLLTALGEAYDPAAAQALAARYKRKDTFMEQASQAAQQGANRAGQTISGAAKSVGALAAGLLKKKPVADASASAESGAHAEYAEAVRRLTLLKEAGLLSDEELQAERKKLIQGVNDGEPAATPPASPPAAQPKPVTETPAVSPVSFELSMLRLLINLAKIDGKIDDAERELLDQVINLADIGEADKLDLWHRLTTPGTHPVELASYMGRFDESISLIVRLVEMANINGVLHPAERLYIKKIAEQVQLPKDDVEAMLAAA